MKTLPMSALILAVTASGAVAGGLDRTGQSTKILYKDGGENGHYLEIGYGSTGVDLSGAGFGISGAGLSSGTSYEGTGQDFTTLDVAFKMQLNDKWAAAFVVEKPFGADVVYPGDPATTELGGAYAKADTTSATAFLQYRFNERVSAHGGLRLQRMNGDIRLSGLGYSSLSGYTATLEDDYGLGYVIGAAYEIPEIAGRVSLTYNSAITHDMDTTEYGSSISALNGTSVTSVEMPQSLNLEFQTGIAPGTLLFGAVRWAEWSAFTVDTKNFTETLGVGLVTLKDSMSYSLGVGRKLNDNLFGAISVAYEEAGDMDVSPLAPSTGMVALGLGLTYDVGDYTLSGGIRHAWLGDANAAPGGNQLAAFTDNTVTSVGMKIGYNF